MKLNLRPLCLIFYRKDLGLRDGLTIYGEAKGFVVWIRQDIMDAHPDPEHNDALQHEFEHVRQAWKRGIFHMIMLNYPPYRAKCEREALIRQMQTPEE
jgi:hypothetical protein